jgi:hypothetical protein
VGDDLVSVKTKSALEKLGFALFVIGLVIAVFLPLIPVFINAENPPSLEEVFGKYWSLMVITGGGCIILGVSTLAFAYKLKPKFPRKLVKRIADYAIPILESKGKVSLRDIAANTGMDVSKVENYLRGAFGCRGMIEDGYFENARLEGGWLVKVAPVLCQYCGTEVQPGAKKCPHCGAIVKK